MTTLAPVRADTLPENTRYIDDGCEMSASCLECPLSVCKYDDPAWLQKENRRTRDDRIFELRKRGVPVMELARQFGVSTRTVHRIIQRGGASQASQDELDDGPLMTLEELESKSIIRPHASYPSLDVFARSA
jgi:hypothetical protein